MRIGWRHTLSTSDTCRIVEGGDPGGVICETYLHRNLLPAHIPALSNDFMGTVGRYHFDITSTITKGNVAKCLPR